MPAPECAEVTAIMSTRSSQARANCREEYIPRL